LVGRETGGVISPLQPQQVRDMLHVDIMSPQTLYNNGALMRDGDNTITGGGTMTGLLFTSFERFTINTGEIRSFDGNVESAYVSCNYMSSGGNIARCRLPNGRADGHRKLIIMSSMTNKSYLVVTGSIRAPATNNCYGLLFYTQGQSAHLQWDTVMNCYIIIGGSGCAAVTLDQVMSDRFPYNVTGVLGGTLEG